MVLCTKVAMSVKQTPILSTMHIIAVAAGPANQTPIAEWLGRGRAAQWDNIGTQ